MHKTSEGRFKGVKDADLYFQVWKADLTKSPDLKLSRGTLIITPGHGEHTESYRRVVQAVETQGWDVYAWDMRGHGRSEGVRGFAESFNVYCEDYKIFLDLVRKQPNVKEKPLVYLSHSMGGLVQLKTLIDHPELQPDAMVLSSPLVGVGVAVPGFKKVGAEWLNKLLPTVTLWNEVRSQDCTRDPEIIREFEQDPLRHARICAGVYLGFMQAFPMAHAGVSKLTCRTLLQITDKDPIVSSPEALRMFENLGSKDKVLKIYNDAKHELYNDTIREQVFEDLREFLAGVQKNQQNSQERT